MYNGRPVKNTSPAQRMIREDKNTTELCSLHPVRQMDITLLFIIVVNFYTVTYDSNQTFTQFVSD